MMSSHQSKYTFTMPNPPPADINSYTRLMHQHTMRQMAEVKAPEQSRDQQTPRQTQNAFSGRVNSGTATRT